MSDTLIETMRGSVRKKTSKKLGFNFDVNIITQRNISKPERQQGKKETDGSWKADINYINKKLFLKYTNHL